VCVEDARRCFAIDLASGKLSAAGFAAKRAPIPPQHGTIEVRDRKLSACYANACRALGEHLRGAIAKAAKAGRPIEPTATSDLAAVIIPDAGDAKVWSVANDRPIVRYGDRGPSGLDTAIAVGTAVYTVWLPPEGVVYTSTGKRISEDLPGETSQVAMLDEHVWYVLGRLDEIDTLFVFDGTPSQKLVTVSLRRCP
jgi:hypothetical protein